MEAETFSHRTGTDERMVFYAVSVTTNEVRMADGGKLEHAGVIPDSVLVPAPADLADGRDPVLAQAVGFAGGRLTPAAAGRLFPIEWPKR